MKRLNLLLIAAAAVWTFLTPGTQGEEAKAPALGPNDNQLQMISPKSAEESKWESSDILQKRVSINFVNTSLENIIRTIHYQAGLNFLYDPALLEGKVMSVRLENVKLKAALDEILKLHKLSYTLSADEGNIVRLAPATETKAEKLEIDSIPMIQIVPLKWVKAKPMADTIKKLFVEQAGEGKGAVGSGTATASTAGTPSFGQMPAAESALATEGAGGETAAPTAEVAGTVPMVAPETGALPGSVSKSTSDIRAMGGLRAVEPDADSNSVLLKGTAAGIEAAKQVIAELDQPQRQVMIEGRMVEMKTEAAKELGFNYSIGRLNNGKLTAGSQSAGFPTVSDTKPILFPGQTEASWGQMLSTPSGAGNVAFYTGKNLMAALDAMENRNIVEILVNPKVITLNNIEATIDILTSIPYKESNMVQGAGSQATWKFKDAGIKITVTPTITSDNFVRMNILTDQKVKTGEKEGTPIIDTRKANTNVIVHSEETVMLGGLRELDTRDYREGVPWLMQAPVVGWLFKNKINSQSKNQLFLFVTPTVLENIAVTTEQKGFFDRIDLKWQLPDYFYDDVRVDEDKN
ncbi:MAG TPA: secretin N-terminal domain-containing protein [Candidatus Sumerlaeota bacterium]|nr:secretin N-terminal domain-containing protein [Candidatus Sumerlaeota bacterium]HPS02190.1 secretin N-terminal domain-containing protein [Candidatus Sumerlaeota bacterium]